MHLLKNMITSRYWYQINVQTKFSRKRSLERTNFIPHFRLVHRTPCTCVYVCAWIRSNLKSWYHSRGTTVLPAHVTHLLFARLVLPMRMVPRVSKNGARVSVWYVYYSLASLIWMLYIDWQWYNKWRISRWIRWCRLIEGLVLDERTASCSRGKSESEVLRVCGES